MFQSDSVNVRQKN